MTASDGWPTYTSDHVALLDHLGIESCHLLGGCIGGSFGLDLLAAAPTRITAAVLQQPIGLSPDNRGAFYKMFDAWAEELVEVRPDVTTDALAGLRTNLYGGEFVFSVSPDEVRSARAPLLVLRAMTSTTPGDLRRNRPHRSTGRAHFELEGGRRSPGAVARVKSFLVAHTPDF